MIGDTSDIWIDNRAAGSQDFEMGEPYVRMTGEKDEPLFAVGSTRGSVSQTAREWTSSDLLPESVIRVLSALPQGLGKVQVLKP